MNIEYVDNTKLYYSKFKKSLGDELKKRNIKFNTQEDKDQLVSKLIEDDFERFSQARQKIRDKKFKKYEGLTSEEMRSELKSRKIPFKIHTIPHFLKVKLVNDDDDRAKSGKDPIPYVAKPISQPTISEYPKTDISKNDVNLNESSNFKYKKVNTNISTPNTQPKSKEEISKMFGFEVDPSDDDPFRSEEEIRKKYELFNEMGGFVSKNYGYLNSPKIDDIVPEKNDLFGGPTTPQQNDPFDY